MCRHPPLIRSEADPVACQRVVDKGQLARSRRRPRCLRRPVLRISKDEESLVQNPFGGLRLLLSSLPFGDQAVDGGLPVVTRLVFEGLALRLVLNQQALPSGSALGRQAREPVGVCELP